MRHTLRRSAVPTKEVLVVPLKNSSHQLLKPGNVLNTCIETWFPLHADRQQIFEIFREYGTITGISLHKGYGFVQFTSELEARAAVEAEHGRRLGVHNPQHLDLRVASEPDESRPVGFKRAFGEFANYEFYDPALLPAQPSAAKRRRFHDASMDDERSGDEPPAWICAMCKHVEVSPWELMKHAAAVHQVLIYDLKAGGGSKAPSGNGTM
ncbi:heterogeneous nuclear ribonucleoprotein C-like 1 [Diadema antillarum]|uniref:heterogeneous nuclear ribonucleoprotein C-like 1 n=1 Tax=Diadema antillarum TaxID=105358 RepID=UPI003A850BD7